MVASISSTRIQSRWLPEFKVVSEPELCTSHNILRNLLTVFIINQKALGNLLYLVHEVFMSLSSDLYLSVSIMFMFLITNQKAWDNIPGVMLQIVYGEVTLWQICLDQHRGGSDGYSCCPVMKLVETPKCRFSCISKGAMSRKKTKVEEVQRVARACHESRIIG
ncbi:hypothetical protein SCA6_002055 [Theobroma cacao]